MRPLKAYLSKSALLHNINTLKAKAPNSKFCAVLKANAYGHRAPLITPVIEKNSDCFAVAMLEEALEIREHSNLPIILLEGIFDIQEYNLCDIHKFIPIITSSFQLNALINSKLKKPLDVYIKINSGMNRLGIHPNELTSFYQKLKSSHNVRHIKLMTHLSSADEPLSLETQKQHNIMARLDKSLQQSLSNSAHIFHTEKPDQEMIRAGIALYGASPYKDKTGEDLNLKPVLELKSKVFHINHIKAGDSVGYGATFTTTQNMTIGIVACGYADGYPREISQQAYTLIDGFKAPIVGRVAMDMLIVDLTNIPESKWSYDVILFGEQLPIEYIAKWANTIPYTIFTHLSKRIHFFITE